MGIHLLVQAQHCISSEHLMAFHGRTGRDQTLQAVINALQVFSAVGPALHESLLAEAARLLPAVGGAACHSRAPVRAAAAAAAASLTAVSPAVMLPELLRYPGSGTSASGTRASRAGQAPALISCCSGGLRFQCIFVGETHCCHEALLYQHL